MNVEIVNFIVFIYFASACELQQDLLSSSLEGLLKRL